MKTVFADSHYWIAVVKPNDPWKKAARGAKSALGEVLIITTAMAGLHKGKITCLKMPISDAPSVRAASSRSLGNPSIYCFMRNILKPSTQNGSIKASRVL